MKFTDKQEDKQGKIGEQIVIDLLERKGGRVYTTSFDGNHPVDFFCTTTDIKSIFIVEVKTKPRMKYPRKDFGLVTGIDTVKYDLYSALAKMYNMNVVLFFVDSLEGKVFSIDMMRADKLLVEKHLTLFPLDDMEVEGVLSSNEVEAMECFTTRSEQYC